MSQVREYIFVRGNSTKTIVSITKTRLLKYTENFTTKKKMKIFK